MAQPDISQILAALAQQQPNGTPQQSATPQQPPPSHQLPPGYPPPGVLPSAPPSAPPQAAYLPQPSSTGSVDLSTIKPVSSGSVSIADAIAKARNIAENRGLQAYDSRAASSTPREDPRLANRRPRSRSRSRSPPRRDAYGGNPYRDERREDPRRGGYRRSPSQERGFRGARDPPIGSRGADGETETIRVKSQLVGLIIGRNGENLRKVEAETGARVQFIQAKDSHVAERQCTISGSLRARENAKGAINAIIEENGGTPTQEKGAYTAGMPGRAKVNLPALRDGEASTQVMVPDKTVGLIIGRGGETVKDLQERSGCHVNIVGENKSVNGLRPVNLIGSERATAMAKELILEIVESDSRAPGGGGGNNAGQPRDRGYQSEGRGGGGGGGANHGGRDHIEKTIQVPSEAVGMIIGKGGETIKDMQRTTGCKINVNQPKPPDHTRNIDLAGNARAMDEAERIIWEKVETVKQRDAAAGRTQGHDQGQYDAYSQPQHAPPAVPGYGSYAAAPQVPPQMPSYQMPVQHATPQPTGEQPAPDPQAVQAWYAQWAAYMQQQQQAPGTHNPPLPPGQKIELNDARIGTVRFVGTTSFQTGEWVGVELEEQSGKNDGSVQGKRYFECAAGYGIFCRASGVARVIQDVPKAKPKAATSNGAPTKTGRPSSIQGSAAVNGTRRQTLVRDDPGRRASTLQGTPTPAGRIASGIRSPVKSPTKQLGTNGTSSASTSRTGTPPAAGKRPVSGVAAKSSRSSIVPSSTTAAGRRTSALPPASGTTASRTTRQPATSTATSRLGTSRLGPGAATSRTTAGTRPGLRERLSAAREEASTGDEASERSGILSPRESTESEAASQAETEDQDGEDDTIRPNFAPPPVPPIPQEPDRTSRQRRPSSPTAASIHSQRTIRSTAASNRQIEELEAKVRLMERKRAEDRELKQNLEKAEQERDQARGIIERLQNKYRPQQQELEKLKREMADFEKRSNELDDIQAKHEMELEEALVERELAEEQAETAKADLEMLRARNEEQALELDILRDENQELSKEMSPEERTSAGWLQLEKSNDRLKEALLSLRDMTQDRESELKEQIEGLEEQVKEVEGIKNKYEETQEQLLKSQADTEDLRQQLEVALNAEDMIERLTEENESLRDKINDLRAAIEDLESLRELNDELEVNHIEVEKQLQEELDFKDSLLLDRERTAKEQQAALDEADYNINRFRELVSQLQSDLQDLEASKQISESEAAQLSSKSRVMMDLNHKLQSSAAKTQVKTIDLELRKLEAQQASEHLAIVQLFLPESFQAERDSVLALLRFKRIGFKANLVQGFIKERVASFGTRGQDEDVFAACDALDKLTWIAAMSERLVNSISGCSAEAFANYGGALYELEVVERTLNDYVDALRRDELKESDMTVRLGRSIEVMTHLSSLHLHNGLADHADDLIMRALLLQSRLDTATSALALTRTMIETSMKPGDDEADEEDEETASDTARILSRLKMIVEQVRNAKVVSGKTHRALFDLQARHLTLEESLLEHFESTEGVATEIASFACKSGNSLQEIFLEEGRAEPFTPSEIASALSRIAMSVFSLGAPESGPYDTLASRLRDLSTLLLDLSSLPTDLDNTVEFERAPAPWVARADELKQTKITSVDTEAELSRALEAVRERDAMLKQKETELDQQSVRIEMLDARMKDASKRSAKIAELERGLREAKEGETNAKAELARAQLEAQQEMDRVREEMARLADERQRTGGSGAVGVGGELDGNAMGASVRITIKRQEHQIAGLESAIRFLEQDNRRLRLPAPDAPHNLTASMSWLHDPLPAPTAAKKKAQRHAALQNEGQKVLEQMLQLATLPPSVDLTSIPKNKLAWRPAKESSRWKVERRNEEWVDWKLWREELQARRYFAVFAAAGRGEWKEIFKLIAVRLCAMLSSTTSSQPVAAHGR
ncbi:hypothetical protein M409DRAFT_62723 [Zasmidium cellare ATCC 36951]|uniref:CAP-Gly domain-containing protein n=1 Tax=Zasmidium cellare ATCC 36951 TaxID=1080233 RepID=A0A6A6D0Z0_ZASCE|nr:uncharacterized protein M409DRAFT_62723 [Zasmidium cellare ATCC 36951]KAF2173104.1 hypothetical protein M409DRAFT_62723 [Zasmidium cellare ATCC 36951]